MVPVQERWYWECWKSAKESYRVKSLKKLPYLPTLKYRRLRGDMIEVFKIIHNYYDTRASVPVFVMVILLQLIQSYLSWNLRWLLKTCVQGRVYWITDSCILQNVWCWYWPSRSEICTFANATHCATCCCKRGQFVGRMHGHMYPTKLVWIYANCLCGKTRKSKSN